MAIPNIEISIIPVNQVVLKNNEAADVIFTLERLNDAGTAFAPYVPVDLTSYVIGAGVENQFTVPDDLYKVSFQDTIDPETYHSYYILADNNIKACKKRLILQNLCGDVTGCNSREEYEFLKLRMKFDVLERGLYYIYSNFINKQSLTMLLVPTNQELKSKKTYLTELLDMCDCNNDGCNDCGTSSSSNFRPISDCGCN